MSDDPVARLLSQVAAQNRAAFHELYATTSAKLFGVLLRMLGQRAEAEDALQEVYVRVWLRAGRYDADRTGAMTWLIAMARNLAIDRLRTRREPAIGDEAVPDALPDAIGSTGTRLVAAGKARRIADCLAALEPDRAAALREAYLGGLSNADLAIRHSMPARAMRGWMRQGLLRLGECLEA